MDEIDREQHDSGDVEPVVPPAAWRDGERASDPEPPAGAETPVDHSASPAPPDSFASPGELEPSPIEPFPAEFEAPRRPDELEALRTSVNEGPVVLVVPPEIFVHFYPATPDQLLNALSKAGFDQVYFETLGDELVALAYLRLWRENHEKRTWIRSTSPLVVEYSREKHPELLPYLAPVVPPAMALARYLRARREHRTLVYAGFDFPEVNGERLFAAAVSFAELEEFLDERSARPEDQSPLLKTLPPERRRFLSAAGGLPLAMLDEERHSSRHFHQLRGLHYLAALSRQIEDGGTRLGFIDILPFDGALDHPSFGRTEELYWRRSILALAEPPPADGPVIDEPPGLDLSIVHTPRPSRLPYDAIQEMEKALEDVR